MNTKLYIDISERLHSQVPEIKHIDLFNEQYSNPKTNHPFNTPAVFIEFGATSWDFESVQEQEGDSLVKVHIVVNTLQDSANIFALTPLVQESRLSHLNLFKKINKALHNWLPTASKNPLSRSNSIPDHNHDGIIVEIHEYWFRDMDNSAGPDWVERKIDSVNTPGQITN